jgi:hypothetical protein
MDDKYIQIAKKYGVDLSDLSSPSAIEYHKCLKLNDPRIQQSMDHSILKMVESPARIKEHNSDDFEYYRKKLTVKDISFWGERFEILVYAQLIQKDKIQDFRRGQAGTEPDFVFAFNHVEIGIETTSVNYQTESLKKDSVKKIMRQVGEKSKKPYANTNTCLIVDITNMMFYRYVLNNFKTTLSELTTTMSSSFGSVLLTYTYHTTIGGELHDVVDYYDVKNNEISPTLKDFLLYMSAPSKNDGEKIFLGRM